MFVLDMTEIPLLLIQDGLSDPSDARRSSTAAW
jgi:hypothetical protein